eukprot:CAMPEP_0184369580 /NCGR_PEP_ID=MMETSP1089-20130417/162327_1 /TAXON_ID=38269 ORGANISM="Gloeochaete wittrockiana, Strain SAG46.84" /NCGR_SAMPLE_ID=MMETSP1089 /ASSEMBLY_ACC=CAM_ASM_000445 /LENGTH=663 /DNA_ID=CAMNT_0026712047 /DNA_START=37 /DNA_END=2025 /DNA_ORIENTATION=+
MSAVEVDPGSAKEMDVRNLASSDLRALLAEKRKEKALTVLDDIYKQKAKLNFVSATKRPAQATTGPASKNKRPRLTEKTVAQTSKPSNSSLSVEEEETKRAAVNGTPRDVSCGEKSLSVSSSTNQSKQPHVQSLSRVESSRVRPQVPLKGVKDQEALKEQPSKKKKKRKNKSRLSKQKRALKLKGDDTPPPPPPPPQVSSLGEDRDGPNTSHQSEDDAAVMDSARSDKKLVTGGVATCQTKMTDFFRVSVRREGTDLGTAPMVDTNNQGDGDKNLIPKEEQVDKNLIPKEDQVDKNLIPKDGACVQTSSSKIMHHTANDQEDEEQKKKERLVTEEEEEVEKFNCNLDPFSAGGKRELEGKSTGDERERCCEIRKQEEREEAFVTQVEKEQTKIETRRGEGCDAIEKQERVGSVCRVEEEIIKIETMAKGSGEGCEKVEKQEREGSVSQVEEGMKKETKGSAQECEKVEKQEREGPVSQVGEGIKKETKGSAQECEKVETQEREGSVRQVEEGIKKETKGSGEECEKVEKQEREGPVSQVEEGMKIETMAKGSGEGGEKVEKQERDVIKAETREKSSGCLVVRCEESEKQKGVSTEEKEEEEEEKVGRKDGVVMGGIILYRQAEMEEEEEVDYEEDVDVFEGEDVIAEEEVKDVEEEEALNKEE